MCEDKECRHQETTPKPLNNAANICMSKTVLFVLFRGLR